MARIRYLKPSFFDHEGLASVSPSARLAFAGLWLQADREGRLKDEPARLRVRIFPYEASVDMSALLGELADIGVIVRYDVSGLRYVGIPGFLEHQRPHPKEPASVLPAWQATEKHGEPWKETASRDVSPSRPGGMGTGIENGNRDGVRERARAALVVSPLEFEKRQQRNAFVSDRFDVPFVLHREFTGRYGKDAEPALQAWYASLHAGLSNDESIPDIFMWLRPLFAAWMAATGRVKGLTTSTATDRALAKLATVQETRK